MESWKIDTHRRHLLASSLSLLLFPACNARKMTANLDIVLFSYLERPIFDVRLNHIDIGVAGAWPYSGRGTIAGVPLPLGPQPISWRLDGPKGTPRNGETVIAKNVPMLNDMAEGSRFLGVHIYPDGTVELIPSMHFPNMSRRGQAFDALWKKRHSEHSQQLSTSPLDASPH